MNPHLQAFLNSIGATLNQHQHCEFDHSQSCEDTNNIIAPLTYYGMLAVEGPDSANFLQGQLSCNVNNVDNQHSIPGAYCTPKGRMVSSFRMARSQSQCYLLRMRRSIVANTQAVLSKYIVFSKAQQHIVSDQYLVFGLHGSAANNAVSSAFGQCPEQYNHSVVKDGNCAIQTDDNGQRFECWIQLTDIDRLWPQLSQGLTPVNSATWELLIIRQGLGEVSEQTVERFIPQMLNFQITGEVSFDKGCYTGQEVVARMHYRGSSKRRMYRIALAGEPVTPGTELHSLENNQSIGTIVNCAQAGDNYAEALAVITIKDAENNQVFVQTNTPPVTLLSLPYAITTKGE